MLNSPEWQNRVDKIVELLNGDAETRQQAIVLLDTLTDSIIEAGVSALFETIFQRPNTSNARFAWMESLRDEMEWREGHRFDKEDVFWPLFDISLKLYPERIQALPPTLDLGNDYCCKRWPSFLYGQHPVRHVVVHNSEMSLQGIEDLQHVESIISWGMRDGDWATIDIDALQHGHGNLRIVSSSNEYYFDSESSLDALAFEEVDGERQLRFCSGVFVQSRPNRLFEQHPHLQVTSFNSLSELARIWSLKTPHDFLDFGIVRMELGGDANETIAERVKSMHLTASEYCEIQLASDDATSERNWLETMFGDATLPRLLSITGEIYTSHFYEKSELYFNSRVLGAVPSLKNVSFNVHEDWDDDERIWCIQFEGCTELIHPLTNVIVENYDTEHLAYAIFFPFEGQSLHERMKATSIDCSTGFSGEPNSLQKMWTKAVNVHLFQTGSDLSMIGYFDRLERLQVELDPYNLKRLLESVVDDEWVELEHLKAQYPIALKYLVVWTDDSYGNVGNVHCLADLQYEVDRDNWFSASPLFIANLREQIETNTLPESFMTWLKGREPIPISKCSIWLDDLNVLHWKAYPSIGTSYLNHMTKWLNVQRVFFAATQAHDELIQAIVAKDPTFLRYNDAHLPLNRLTELGSLRELRFEVSVDLDLLPILPNLEVLYLHDMNLTQLPEQIVQMTSLRELHVWGNPLIELPVSLQNLERLEVLHISGSQLDVFPEVICNLPALKKVIWRGGVTLWMQKLSNDSTWRDRVFTEGIQMYDCESTSAPSEQTAEQT